MNTTALYIFPINDCKQLSFFSPYYGDPESVVKRFLQMQCDKTCDTGYAIQFFKANADLEFARDHHVISDYIYTLNNKGWLQASAYMKTGRDVFFEGTWEEFIDQYDGLKF